jgi:hypothetical protein
MRKGQVVRPMLGAGGLVHGGGPHAGPHGDGWSHEVEPGINPTVTLAKQRLNMIVKLV